MSRSDQPEPRESHGDLQPDAAEGARAALSMDSIPPVPGATGCVDKNSSALEGFPNEDLISEGRLIRLAPGPAGVGFSDRVAKPGQGGGSSDTYKDFDGGGGERYPGSGRNFKASADVPTPPVQTLTDAQRRKLAQDMLPIWGEGLAAQQERLRKS